MSDKQQVLVTPGILSGHQPAETQNLLSSSSQLVASGPPHPLVLMERLISSPHTADELQTLYNLQRAWKADIAAEAYSKAMNECQSEMPAIIKDKQNTHTNARYASWEALNELIRPVYSRHGFSLSFTEDPAKSSEAGLWMICYCRHAGGHVETAQGFFPRDGTGAKGNQIAMTPIQAVGSTRSYAKRYLSKDIFALAETDEDNDGNKSGQFITTEQVGILEKAIKLVYPNPLKFMEWLKSTPCKTDQLKEIPASEYKKIYLAIERAAKKNGIAMPDQDKPREPGEDG